jgi:hypothetical protein
VINFKGGFIQSQFVRILILNDPAGYQLFFRSKDDGQIWGEIYAFEKTDRAINVNTVTFVGNNNVYLQETGLGAPWDYSSFPYDLAILHSTNGGYSYQDAISPTIDGKMSSMCVDGEDIWVGSTSGGIYKNGSYDQVADLNGDIPLGIVPLPGFFLIATLNDDNTGGIYLSTDNAETFTRLGASDEFKGPFAFTYNSKTKTIYAANRRVDSDRTIYKWTVGTSLAWDEVKTFHSAISGLLIAIDGTFYVSTPNDTTAQLWFCVNFAGSARSHAFHPVPGTAVGSSGFHGTIYPGPVTCVSGKGKGINQLYQAVLVDAFTTSPNGYPSVILTHGDKFN